MATDDHWGPLPSAAPGSPNVLLILFDDLGFGQFGCYGSPIATPHIDALAAGGLRYNRFHVTALCSPSRAALLTGRNHHRSGVGFLVDIPLDAPGYHARRPPTMGTLPQHLVANGYSAWAVGKWHLAPTGSRSNAGPFEMWPLGWGFERYYGFLRGDTNQWAPELVQDNHYVEAPRSYTEGYHVSEDLAERMIGNIRDQRQATPGKPFFGYLAFGAMHAPHQVAREWVEPYRGRFDAGWEALREETFARQVAEGIVPPTAQLTPRPSWVPAWDSLSAEERRLFTTMQETYAGFLTHTDAQIGRVIEHLRATGDLDNTIVMVMSDNGASAEGGTLGTFNEHRFTSRFPESVERSLQWADDWGGVDTFSHYSWGWAWAGNTPFRLWKRYAWLGGTRSPLVVHWPRGIADAGAVRGQVSHIVDLLPTVLDACGVVPADTLGGVAQESLDGASLLPSFTAADAPDPREVQYFEMLGSRALIRGRWKATTDHVSSGVADEERLLEGSRDFAADRWCLFSLDDDFSEAVDVADEHPELVAEMAALWDREAARNGVLPLKDDLRAEGVEVLQPPYPANRRMTYHPDGGPVSDDLMPLLAFGGETSAVVTVPEGGGEGVIFEIGDWNSGLAMVLLAGRVVVAVSNSGETGRVEVAAPLAAGEHTIGAEFRHLPPWTLTVSVDGEVVGETAIPYGLPITWQHGGAMLSLGRGRGLPVEHTYTNPFPFNGEVHHVTFDNDTDSMRATLEMVRATLRHE